jgi:hypothetical protein
MLLPTRRQGQVFESEGSPIPATQSRRHGDAGAAGHPAVLKPPVLSSIAPAVTNVDKTSET